MNESLNLTEGQETTLAQQLELPDNFMESLAPRAQQQIQAMAQNIDITDKDKVMVFGSEQEATLSKLADNMLQGAGSSAIEEIGQLFDDVLAILCGYESVYDGKKESIKDKYTKTDTKISTIVESLNQKELEIKRISREYDEMFEENKRTYVYLTSVIAAGEIAEQDAKNRLEIMQNDPNAAPQDICDYVEAINRFDRRLYNLKLCRALAISTVVQIRNAQKCADVVAESIHQK